MTPGPPAPASDHLQTTPAGLPATCSSPLGQAPLPLPLLAAQQFCQGPIMVCRQQGAGGDLRVGQAGIELDTILAAAKIADQGNQGQLVASVRLLAPAAQCEVGRMPELALPARVAASVRPQARLESGQARLQSVHAWPHMLAGRRLPLPLSQL